MHGFRCYVNIAPNAKCQQVLVLAVCLVVLVIVSHAGNCCCINFTKCASDNIIFKVIVLSAFRTLLVVQK